MSDLETLARFSIVDLIRRTGDVKNAAIRAPVAITERGKPRFVLMTVEDYSRLRTTQNPHRHYDVTETPEFIIDLFGDQLGLNDENQQ
jgi:antitoxin Phd